MSYPAAGTMRLVGGEMGLPALTRRGQRCLRMCGWAASLPAVGLCPGARAGHGQPGWKRPVPAPLPAASQCHLPLSIPLVGLGPSVSSPCPADPQRRGPCSHSPKPRFSWPGQIRATSFLPGMPLKTPESLLACRWSVLLLPLPMSRPQAEGAAEPFSTQLPLSRPILSYR